MNLIIDIGNTQIKAAFFENNKILRLKNSKTGEMEFITDLVSKYENIQHIIISSVREYPEKLVNSLQEKNRLVLFFNGEIETPLENLYESKSTLGYDRLAACAGANSLYSNKNCLVIDAGTAITFDFVTEKNQYLGGCISPGLQMRFKALHHYTKKLPELMPDEDFHLIGKNTKEAIVSGVQNGLIFEIDSYIDNLQKKHSDLQVIITGGDANFLSKHLTNMVDLQPQIVAIGLNKILEYNLLIRY
ncbi:type III pantothenate kinase [Labilibaculum sp.]|uniref:type III pantothenate kinase n=1 Tax=Labilibaculum sp. TaxID=2060723 RepID=UPI003568B517